jgi:hypothetical protein
MQAKKRSCHCDELPSLTTKDERASVRSQPKHLKHWWGQLLPRCRPQPLHFPVV